jgi:hypothetical protein
MFTGKVVLLAFAAGVGAGIFAERHYNVPDLFSMVPQKISGAVQDGIKKVRDVEESSRK